MGYIHISDEMEAVIKEAAMKNDPQIKPGEEIERGYNGYLNCDKRLEEQRKYYENQKKHIYEWVEKTTESLFSLKLKMEDAEIFKDTSDKK
jgi:hypothetical protein